MPNPNTSAAPAASTETDDFEAEFARLASERRGAAPAQEDSDSTQDAGADTNDDEQPAQGSTAAEAAPEVKPPPSPQADTQQAPPAQGSQQGGSATRTVAELERELADALHRERSSANRVSERDRRANELARENETLKTQLAELRRQPAAKPAAGQSAEPETGEAGE
jgi:hypothetical protein